MLSVAIDPKPDLDLILNPNHHQTITTLTIILIFDPNVMLRYSHSLEGYSQVNTHKYFFTYRICDIWNALPSSVVEASSLTVFKRLLDNVDLTRYFIDIR